MSENYERIQEQLERLKNSTMEIGKAIYSQSDSGSQAEQPQEES